jgi:hypothetical protein
MPAEQHGYRPNVSAHAMAREVGLLTNRGHTSRSTEYQRLVDRFALQLPARPKTPVDIRPLSRESITTLPHSISKL